VFSSGINFIRVNYHRVSFYVNFPNAISIGPPKPSLTSFIKIGVYVLL